MRWYILSSFVIILVLLNIASATAQSSSLDWNLAMLRGSWQYHTYDYKLKLVCESDNILVYDGDEMKYELIPGAMVVRGDDSEEEWKYVFDEDELQITFPSGEQTTFERDGNGELEEQLSGKFYTPSDTPMVYAMIGLMSGFRSMANDTSPPHSRHWTTRSNR